MKTSKSVSSKKNSRSMESSMPMSFKSLNQSLKSMPKMISKKAAKIDQRVLLAAGVIAIGALAFVVYRNRSAIASSKVTGKLKGILGSIRELISEAEPTQALAKISPAELLEQKETNRKSGFSPVEERAKSSRAALHKSERMGASH